MQLLRSNCETIQKPVKIVSGIVERNSTVPIVNNIMIDVKGTNAVFTTTDLDTQVVTSAPVGFSDESEGCFTVSAQKLGDILSTIKGSAPVELSVEDGVAMLATTNGQFQLQTLPADDFPSFDAVDWTREIKISAKKLRRVLALTSFAMANKDIRYFLNGVLIVTSGSTVRCVATDTHRLSFCECELEEGQFFEEPHDAIIPRKTVRELLRILPEDDSEVQIRFGDMQVEFSFTDVTYRSKLVDGKFPDYERVMPTFESNPCVIRINREELISALRRAQIMTNEKFNGVRWLLSRGNLQIQGTNNEQEEATQDIAVDWTWDDLDMGFNVLYLIDALSNLKNNEVSFHFAQTPRSVLLTMPETTDFRYVVMPMRI